MNRVMMILPGLALVFLAFIGGATSMYFNTGVPVFLTEAYKELEAALTQGGYMAQREWLHIGAKPEEVDDWNNPPVPDIEPGLKLYNPDLAQNGYTLYSSFYLGSPIVLVDMQGKAVHTWQLPMKFNNGKRDDGVKFRPDAKPLSGDVHLYEDGRLLVNFNHSLGYPPWGFGLAMLDKDSNPIWSYMKQVHHLFEVTPDGNIIAMLHSWQDEPWPGLETIKTRFQHEELAVLSPEGEELQVVSILRAIQNSPYASILQYANPEAATGDIFHANAVRYLDAQQAAAIPNAAEGDVLVSLRDMDTLIVLDLDAETVKWATRGPWHMQHDPRVLDNGNIMLFDNRGDLANGGHSRILEFNPRSQKIEWEWPGEQDVDFYTPICGTAERLENGNTLIAESNRGRLFEITRDGEIVWDFFIPERTEYTNYMTTKVLNTKRIDPATLSFLDQPASD